jgi:colicin import membrane protein
VRDKVVLPENPQGRAPAPQRPGKAEGEADRGKGTAPKAPARPAEADYDDVLERLRREAGEGGQGGGGGRAAGQSDVAHAGPGLGAAGGGIVVSAEVIAWLRAARLQVRQAWVLEPGFRYEPLETQVLVDLDAAGAIQGEPRVSQSSGNSWYDDSVVRAIQKASPLPPPPSPGTWSFVFRPEDRL